jgi:5-methyltetrahydrofolate--homocysteine methyltransferase
MPLIVSELHQRGLKIPVLIGGAAINRRFGWRVLFPQVDDPYEPGVFYCKDAFEGLATIDALMNPIEKPELIKRLHAEARNELKRDLNLEGTRHEHVSSRIKPLPIRLPSNQSYGARVVRHMPLEIIFQHLSKNELFRLSWGAKNAHGEDWEQLKAMFELRLDKMTREALRTGWLKPQAVYGYWPAASEGEDLIIYTADGVNAVKPIELMRFTFPRQPDGDRLCLSDYFVPAGSAQLDVVAFQIVTVGEEATQRFDEIQADDDYSEAYYSHGLAVQTAEATAEYLHRHIRREMGIPEGQGKRYSWGYPAIPELEDHRKVFDLLPAERELGMSLTSAYQLVPEQSTAAILVHHPEASYFSIGKSRVEQLIQGAKP